MTTAVAVVAIASRPVGPGTRANIGETDIGEDPVADAALIPTKGGPA